jgi:hypothetical protein
MIVINLDKAKNIAHDKRREARAEEFKPFDDIIAKQIPGKDAQEAEASRQAIREKYSTMQEAIDASQSVEELKQAIGGE